MNSTPITHSGVGQPAEDARGAAAVSKSTSGSKRSSNNHNAMMPPGTQIRVSCCVIAGPLADPPAELLQVLALFTSPLWLHQVLPGLAAAAAQLHTCSIIRGSDAQHFSQLQQRVKLLLQLQKLQQQQQQLLHELKRVVQLQQQRVAQQHAVVSSLRAAAEHRQQQQLQLLREQHLKTRQQERQQARWERLLQRRVQQQEMEAEANKSRLAILSSACGALAFSYEHFKQSVLRQLLLPQLLQQDLLLRRIEMLLQRCRRIGFLRRQLKKASSSSSSSNTGREVPAQQQEPQQNEQQEPLRGEVMTSLAYGVNELLAVLRMRA
ncbi:uncharacterized protein EMH_0033140 [Eimeria mitis]|uniref:Uncharacterized protein n=1 Tax=Eimeria mitis TaxID=44415 RepID=U6JU40_9EIME|nr:uncharacterized protein EMH_0033140 [Eimeria mitis]CDJ27587.1 hypothetical protein EMH_0033140 [Eimeria mitis]